MALETGVNIPMRSGAFACLVFQLTACGAPTPTVAARIAALPAPYNAGDYEKGRRLYAQCSACHTIDVGRGNRVGPYLHGVMGRTAGTATDFRGYSEDLRQSGVTWDPATLDRWIADPRDVVAVNNMIYPGVPRPEDRRDLVAYIAVESAD